MDAKRLALTLALLTGAPLLLPPAEARAHGGKYTPPPETPPDPPPPDPPAPPMREKPPLPPRTPEPTPPPRPDTPTPLPPGGGGGIPTPGGGPRTPPKSQPTPGSKSNRRSAAADPEDWSTWWYYSRDRYLLRRAGVATTGGLAAAAGQGDPADPALRAAAGDGWRAGALDALRDSFPDPDTEIFTGCAVALGKGGDPADAPRLLALLGGRYRDPSIRESLVLSLGLLGRSAPGAREALVSLLRDREDAPRLRGFAGIALGLSGDAGSAPALLAAAAERGPSKDPSVGALLGLGLLGEDIVVPDLLEILAADGDTDARALRPYAAFALARIGGPEAVAALGRSLSDGDEQVRRAAAAGLGERTAAEIGDWVAALGKAAREDRDRAVRSFATLSLGRVGGPAALEALSRCFGLGDRGERNFAALGLALYARSLDDVEGRRRIASLLRTEFEQREDAGYRGALAVSLGLAGDPRAVTALRAVLADRGDPDLRAHCALALGMIGAREAAGDLRAALAEKGQQDLAREAALALGLLGDPAAAGLLAGILEGTPSEYLRTSAAMALGQLRGPEAAKALAALLLDPAAGGAARGQAAVGLGLLLDPRPLGAMANLAPGLNYMAPTPVVLEVLTIP